MSEGGLVRRYVLKLVSDIQFLESKPFDVNVNGKITKVEFMLGELPNDMKMLCFLGGELSNAAHYFSTFADVNKSNCNDIKKVGFGKNDWKPFSYDERVKDAKKALEKSKELAKSKSSKQTKRTNLTTYIRQVLKSRQEEKALVSKYIERAKSEPLHLKNNVVKELFNKLLQVCVSQSRLQNIKSFNDIPHDVLFAKFVSFIRFEMGCNYLSTKIVQWYNESSRNLETSLTFRFRGKESFAFLRHFTTLISMIVQNVSSEPVILHLHKIYIQFIYLRKVVSYTVRIEDFNSDILSDMEKCCAMLFRSCVAFDNRITPSL